jgi:catechol 2,3-dioxygenase-like lactoylglutathione lyase family enzyme
MSMTPPTTTTTSARSSSFEEDEGDDTARTLVPNQDHNHNYNNHNNHIYIHHTAIKTRNMTMALQFYSLLGLEATTKFRAGPAKAAWLQPRQPPQHGGCQDDKAEEEEETLREGTRRRHRRSSSGGSNFRLELIEIPSYLLEEEESIATATTPKRAPDLMKHVTAMGLNHIALDVTSSIQQRLEESKKDNVDVDAGDGPRVTSSTTTGLLSAWLEELNQQSVNQFGKTLRMAVQPYQTMIGNGVYELAFMYDADGTLIELLYLQTELPQTIGSGWDPTERMEFQQ